MQSNLRKTIGILLSPVILLSGFGRLTLTSSAAAPEPENCVLVTFGSYPQSLVTYETLKTELNSPAERWTDSDRTYYDYYVDSAHEDFMKYADVIPATGEKEEKPNFGPCVICGKYHNGDAADRLIGALHSLIHRFVALREYLAALL